MSKVLTKRLLRGRTFQLVLFVTTVMAIALLVSRAKAAQAETPSSRAVPQSSYLTPVEAKISRDGRRLYVVCEDDDSVLAVDLRTERVVARAKVGHKPKDVAVSPDGRTLYISNEWSDTVTELDAATFTARRTLPTGWGPIGLTTDSTGKVLYVANSISNDISLVDLTNGVEIKRLASWRSPHQLQLSRDGRRVYVSNLLPHLGSPDEPPVSELTVIDTQKRRVAERILIPGVLELRHIAEATIERGGYLLVPFMRPKNLNPLIQVAQGWIVTHGMAVVWPAMNAGEGVKRSKVTQVLLDDPDYYYAGGNGTAFTPLGRYAVVTHSDADVVSIIDAPDDAAATALAMSVGKLGYIRTQSLRAFSAAELASIMDKVV